MNRQERVEELVSKLVDAMTQMVKGSRISTAEFMQALSVTVALLVYEVAKDNQEAAAYAQFVEAMHDAFTRLMELHTREDES